MQFLILNDFFRKFNDINKTTIQKTCNEMNDGFCEIRHYNFELNKSFIVTFLFDVVKWSGMCDKMKDAWLGKWSTSPSKPSGIIFV